ncbi:MAG: efflux RND transporter periplasmic adaptor subunit [Clostridiales bacterium]|jgi:HlyD family secretion protein|nr:efflux RND transporter periplasmic adaptor subunit [Clostridiales bacterium]
MRQSGKLKKVFRVVLILIIIAAIGAGGFFSFQAFRQNQTRTAMAASMASAASIQPAAVQDISEIVSASGVVKLRKEESVYAVTSERVSEVMVEVGDKVEEGQVIVLYDIEEKRKQLEKQIQQTELNLNNQNLTLQSMTIPAGESTVKQLQTSVDSADKSLFDAQSSIEATELKIGDQQEAIARAQETYGNSQDNIDKADRNIAKAMENIEKAQRKVTEAEEELAKQKQLLDIDGISEDEYKKFEDAVETARDNVQQAEDALETAQDAKKQAEDAKKQAGYSVDSAENTLRDLQNTLESNKRNAASAQTNLANAQSNLADASVVLKEESDRINYEKQRNQIALLELDLADYKEQLEDLTENAVSPMTGAITAVNAAKGKSVDTSTILVTIADFEELIVTANISEYDIPKLELGQPVVMTSDGIENVLYTGSVTKISDSAQTQNATSGSETVVPVEISFDRLAAGMKPGFNLELEITVAHSPQAVTVPITALQKDAESGGYSVFVVGEDRTLKKTSITKGITSDMVVEITSGVNEGDMVIVSPTETMRDGASMDELGGNGAARADGGGFSMFGGNSRPNAGMNMGGGVRVNAGPGAGGRQ